MESQGDATADGDNVKSREGGKEMSWLLPSCYLPISCQLRAEQGRAMSDTEGNQAQDGTEGRVR